MLRNHPRGLLVLFLTEMWERFGFYTLLAIYTLYMDEVLGWSDARKSDFYGWFLGAVYFIPILGGWLGDRVLGPRGTIRLGAALMAVGYSALALSSRAWIGPFYLGLLLIAFGTGIFKVNMSILVGGLYPEGSPLRDSAFNIYYMGVNLGAAVSPLAATWIHDQFGSYNLAFWAAAAGMLVCMVVFQWGKRHLILAQAGPAPADAGRRGAAHPTPQCASAAAGGVPALEDEGAQGSGHSGPAGSSAAAASPAPGGESADAPRPPARPGDRETSARWSPEDRRRVVTLIVLFAIAIFFWIGFYQNGFVLTLFAQRSTIVYRFLRPETYQFFGPLFILILTPPLVGAFNRMRERGREPSSASKISAGLFISGLSLLVMVWAGLAGGDADQNVMSPWWLIGSYLLVSLGEILVSPMGQSLVTQVAPRRIRGLMMGFWFSATAAGSYSSGVLGRLYAEMTHHGYFLLIAALLFLGALLALMSRRRLDRFSR